MHEVNFSKTVESYEMESKTKDRVTVNICYGLSDEEEGEVEALLN